MWHVVVPLSRLLVRHGRGDEAIEVVRTLADRPGGAEDRIVRTLCDLYADHGRAHEGLAYLDALKERRGGAEDWDFFRMRLSLMAGCGLVDEAIERARAHPQGDTWHERAYGHGIGRSDGGGLPQVLGRSTAWILAALSGMLRRRAFEGRADLRGRQLRGGRRIRRLGQQLQGVTGVQVVERLQGGGEVVEQGVLRLPDGVSQGR
ncbi:hypothetical protein ACIRYZ_37170 [Kitasatospora sp. NPDC101155]|uniref:hypothetical protein n=1 Tax=Kitasatospora sp. NPDC101155 TaxID=3364097 RepID=UPI00381E1445